MNNKDTYWFPHDYTPTDDPKIQAMLGDYGGVGYGIYWRIVEMLHSESLHKIPFKKYIYSSIAKQMQPNAKQNKFLLNAADISVELIETFINDCIKEYELFVSDETHFWSNRSDRNIEKKKGISEERSKAGKNSAKSKKVNKSQQKSTIVEQTSTTTLHNTTLQKKRLDYIKEYTHHHYSDKNELYCAAAAEIKMISSSFEEYMFISNRHLDFLSKKISEKYINEQPIKNLKSLLLEWLERDKKTNKDEYINNNEFSKL